MNRKSAVVTLVIAILIFFTSPKHKRREFLGSAGFLFDMDQQFLRLFQGLRKLGWFVGDNIAIETRFGEERYDQLPKLAAELVQLNVDVIVAADAPVSCTDRFT